MMPLEVAMIIKIGNQKYELESKKKDPKTGRHKDLGQFRSERAAKRREAQVEYFKHVK